MIESAKIESGKVLGKARHQIKQDLINEQMKLYSSGSESSDSPYEYDSDSSNENNSSDSDSYIPRRQMIVH